MANGEDGRVIAWGAELRAVHVRLRKALAVAREAVEDHDAEDEGSPDAARDLLLYCHGFCVALSGHHRSEDSTLFPQIAAAKPELVPVLETLTRDHGMLDYLIAELEKSLVGGSTTEEKLRHLDGIEAVMETHFGYEERQLIAVLDAASEIGAALGTDTSRVLGAIA